MRINWLKSMLDEHTIIKSQDYWDWNWNLQWIERASGTIWAKNVHRNQCLFRCRCFQSWNHDLHLLIFHIVMDSTAFLKMPPPMEHHHQCNYEGTKILKLSVNYSDYYEILPLSPFMHKSPSHTHSFERLSNFLSPQAWIFCKDDNYIVNF